MGGANYDERNGEDRKEIHVIPITREVSEICKCWRVGKKLSIIGFSSAHHTATTSREEPGAG